MAALREWHPARDGVGHADRSWLHNALSLDAQSRSVRLSLADGRRHSHSHSYGNANADSHGNGDRYANRHSYDDTYRNTRQGHAYAKAASDAATTAIARN
jgi:hypothetical protein